MSSSASIVGTGESPYTRYPVPGTSTSSIIADAVARALANANLSIHDVDGFGVSSFTLGPDHAIDLAWRLGMRLTWLMQDTNGGASAGGMLQHAVRAIEAGDASVIVLAAGDVMDRDAFTHLVAHYNSATEDHLAPLPMSGPNALFAMQTTRQMQALGLERSDYGQVVTSQRRWASKNPGAVYRNILTLDDYLAAPMVASPLGRYDCVPPVTGADAVIVTADERGTSGPRARILAVTASYNSDDQRGDGLVTGLADVSPRAWELASIEPEDVDVVSVYDDYPSMVVAQLADMGFVNPGRDMSSFIAEKIATHALPVNTSGGQLSAGQAGSAGGMHGLVEVARQLHGQAVGRQVDARIGVVSGYGMVLYRHGSCANVAVLEAV